MPTIIKQHTKVNFTNVNIPVKYIVEHDTGVLGQTAKNNAEYFENTYRGASAHYFVDKTSIYEVVAAGKKAWHVGDDKDDSDGINNGNTVGIELCAEKDGTFHPQTIANAAWLTQKLMKDFRVPASKVVRHYDASGKNCPQRMNTDGKWTLWYKYHKQLTGQTVTTSPTNASGSKSTTHKVVSGDTLWGLSKQYNATVAQLKEWNNLKSDVIVVGTTLTLKKGTVAPTNNPTPVASTPKATLIVDGKWGSNTTKELQEYFKTIIDGVISGQPSNRSTKNIPSAKFGNGGSNLILAMQTWAGTPKDGKISEVSSLITFLQKRFGTPVDGYVSEVSSMVKELQRRLNAGKL